MAVPEDARRLVRPRIESTRPETAAKPDTRLNVGGARQQARRRAGAARARSALLHAPPARPGAPQSLAWSSRLPPHPPRPSPRVMTLIFAGVVSAIIYCLGIYTPSRVDSDAFYTLANYDLSTANRTINAIADVSAALIYNEETAVSRLGPNGLTRGPRARRCQQQRRRRDPRLPAHTRRACAPPSLAPLQLPLDPALFPYPARPCRPTLASPSPTPSWPTTPPPCSTPPAS